MNWIWRAVVVSALGFVVGCAQPAPPVIGTVERLSVRVEPTDQGSLDVREEWAIRADATGAIRFRHVVRPEEADRLDFVTAMLDYRAVDPGKNGFDIRASDDENLVSVEWTTETAPGRLHTVLLMYRAIASIAVLEPRATMSWPVLTANRGYDVGRVDTVFVLAEDQNTYPGTGMVEAGWTVERGAEGVVSTHGPVTNAETATMVAAFDFDRSDAIDPVWERNRDRRRQFWPAILAAGLFFIVIGVGTLVILRMQYPSRRRPRSPDVPDPPDSERDLVVSGLRKAGVTGAAVALGCALVATLSLSFLGPVVQLIPGSMLLVSIVFVAVAPWYRR